MTDLIEQMPVSGQIWKHTKTGGHYKIHGGTMNAVTDRIDVIYAPLYPSDFSLFSRQLRGHPKAFLSRNDDGSPRFVRVADVGAKHMWEWLEKPKQEGNTE